MKAVIYARFSPRKNADKCESIETQLEICRKMCDLNELEIIGEHEDRAISGAKAENRPGFQAAMAQACKERAVMVVYSLSRFARSTKDAIEGIERLRKAGADLISKKEAIDTTTPTGRFIFTVFSALNELEREQIADRTRDAMLRHQANGRRMSRYVPFGWKRHPTTPALLLEDDEEQAVIKDIVQWYQEENLGIRLIAQRLDRQGTCRRGRWNHTLVRSILIRANAYIEGGRKRKGGN